MITNEINETEQPKHINKKRNSLSNQISSKSKNIIKFLFNSEKTQLDHLHEHVQILAYNSSVTIDGKGPTEQEYNVSKKNEKKYKKSSNSNSNVNGSNILVFRENTGNVLEALRNIEFDPVKNYAISKNPLRTTVLSGYAYNRRKEEGLSVALFSTGKKYTDNKFYHVSRTEDNLIGLKNLVIDIDCHEDISAAELQKRADIFINSFIFEGLPVPTAVLFSGRGFHIYYSLHEASADLIWLYKIIASKIADIYDDLLITKNLHKLGFSVDKTSSCNASGVIRIPGSPNPQAELEPQIIMFNDYKYDLNELKEAFKIEVVTKTASDNIKELGSTTDISTDVMPKSLEEIEEQEQRRKEFVNRLVTKRLFVLENCVKHYNRNTTIGCREVYMFMHYNLLKQMYGPDRAAFLVKRFNKRTFTTPLKDYEMDNLINGVNHAKFGYYKYTNQKFAEILQLTDKEIKKYKLDKSGGVSKRELIAIKKKKAKQERNLKIIYTFTTTGDYALAAKVGNVCERTVRNIVKKGDKIVRMLKKKQKLARDRRVFRSFVENQNIKKAAKAGSCSRNTAVKIVRNYASILRYLNELLNDNELYIPKKYWDDKAKHFDIFFKSEFKMIEKIVNETTGIEPEYLKIAIAPYILYTDDTDILEYDKNNGDSLNQFKILKNIKSSFEKINKERICACA